MNIYDSPLNVSIKNTLISNRIETMEQLKAVVEAPLRNNQPWYSRFRNLGRKKADAIVAWSGFKPNLPVIRKRTPRTHCPHCGHTLP